MPRPDPRPAWNYRRFIEICEEKGIESSTDLLTTLTVYCAGEGLRPPSHGAVSRWWHGERNPLHGLSDRLPWAHDIARALGVSFEDLTTPDAPEAS